MNFENLKERIEGWLLPVLQEKNLYLVEIKISSGRKIEVFIDSDTGVHIDDCAAVSRFLEKHLEESGQVPANYILEVSSPGMNNPLRLPRQYKKYIGRLFQVIKTDGTAFEAQLTEADDEKIKLREVKEESGKKRLRDGGRGTGDEGTKEYEVRYEDIKRAVLQFKF